MSIFVVDVRTKKTPGRKRYNVSRRPHFRDDVHARNFGNPYGKGYVEADYVAWALGHHHDALVLLGQTGASVDIELACWCHAKPRCHAYIVKRLAEQLAG